MTVVNVTGPVATGYGSSANTTYSNPIGKGYVIGDGYWLTAGHVALEWDRVSGTAPNIVSNPGLVGKIHDYRGYSAAYAAAAISASAASSPSAPIPNHEIEGKSGVHPKDTIVISGQSGSTGNSSAGLVSFLDPNDLLTAKAAIGDSSATIKRAAMTTVTGQITFAAGGRLEFDRVSQGGDSGGAYILTSGGRSWVIGTHYGNNGSGTAATKANGTYFTPAEWSSLSSLVVTGKTGDISTSEPVNLLVGTISGETLLGTARPDLLLGRGGADVIDGGDRHSASPQAWGSDYLYGGDGDDSFTPGFGNDLLHGGDRLSVSSTDAKINSDGRDKVDYSALPTTSSNKGIQIHISNSFPASTHNNHKDVLRASYVTDQERNKDTDTLISVEDIVATREDDILIISTFNSKRVAGFDSPDLPISGGVTSIDLGDQVKGDLVDFTEMTEAIKVDMNHANPFVSSLASDTQRILLKGVEQIIGSSHNDDITGGAGSKTLSGFGGDDIIRGGDDSDIIFSGIGYDQVYGLGGDDKIVVSEFGKIAQSNNTVVDGGLGNDLIWIARTEQLIVGPSTAQIVLEDGDTGDRIIWNQHQLSGGVFKVIQNLTYTSDGIPENGGITGYIGALGEVYQWYELQAQDSQELSILLPDMTTIFVPRFQNGDYGLLFASRPSDEFGSDVPRTQNAGVDYGDTEESFYRRIADIEGRQAAFSGQGSTVAPVAPGPRALGTIAESRSQDPRYEALHSLESFSSVVMDSSDSSSEMYMGIVNYRYMHEHLQ